MSLVAVGLMAAKDRVELAAEFRLPVRLPHLGFLFAVKGVLAKAEAQKDLLVSRGMSVTLLEDLSKGVAEFESTLEASRAGRRDHVGASADLEAVSSEIVEQVRVLDGLVRYRFGSNRELMGGWQSARNVTGPPRSRATSSPDEGVAPVSPGDIAPAA
jgi:hypothetical protein